MLGNLTPLNAAICLYGGWFVVSAIVIIMTLTKKQNEHLKADFKVCAYGLASVTALTGILYFIL